MDLSESPVTHQESPATACAEPAPLVWEDPFRLDTLLTEEERMIRCTARANCQDRLKPRAIEANRHSILHRETTTEMGDLGLLGQTAPEEHLCVGADCASCGHVAREVERVDCGYRSAMSVQGSLVMHPIFACGSEEQRQEFPPKLASGEWVGCFDLTEPDRCSDPGFMITRAKKADGGCTISGAKNWIAKGSIADAFVVWAKSDEHGGKIRGIVLEMGMKDLNAPKIEGDSSHRAPVTRIIQTNGVFAPEKSLLPRAEGPSGRFGCLNRARNGIGWGVVGAAEVCWHAAREYVMDRRQFGKPLSAMQLVQKNWRTCRPTFSLGLLGSLRLGRLMDEHRSSAELISLVRRNSCGEALAIAREARDMHGAIGVSDDCGIIQHVMNLGAVKTYEGPHDAHAPILGRSQAGLQAFQ